MVVAAFESLVAQFLKDAHLLEAHAEAASPEEVPTFPSDETEQAGLGASRDEGACALDDIRVEAAAQALVPRHHDDQRLAAGLSLADGEQRVDRGVDP